MTTEHLIEKAKAGLAAFDLYWGDGGPVDAAYGRPWELIRGLLAVFEEARTPTNDEREALDYVDALAADGSLSEGARLNLRSMIAGFRPSEVSEPSECAQGEPSDAHYEYHETRRPDGSWSFTHRSECFCEKRENHWSPDRSKLLAAANAYMHYAPPYDDLSAFSDQFLNDMRAALRAAAEAGGVR